MGLLSEGQPLTWQQTEQYQDFVRKWGVEQFIRLYKKLNLLECDVLMWGDEIEYTVMVFDHEKQVVRLLPIAEQLLPVLQEPELRGNGAVVETLWRPEYASYCVEGIPGSPYNGKYEELLMVEENMALRRKTLQQLLHHVFKTAMEYNGHAKALNGEQHTSDEIGESCLGHLEPCVMTITGFPRLGCYPFTMPDFKPDPKTSFTKSLFWPDRGTYLGHPRFKTLSVNIRKRRGKKVCIKVPVYPSKGLNNQELVRELKECGADEQTIEDSAAKSGHIYMDAMGFGMGMSCLQVTFQASNMREAKVLYDQLAPLCPILLALTASSPIYRGYLADVDCRWNVISSSVDDRKAEEQGEYESSSEQMITNGSRRIPKSRYASISSYLSKCASQHKYNDIDLVYDEQVYHRMSEEGVDELMAKHIAHLFIRDTISLFSEKVAADPPDLDDTDHFENIQSTNWQTMRFKPPPPNSNIGWRVEFRPCELQFTDFENAAIVCFIVLLTRVILSRKYNIMIPISKVDVNMERAQQRDAIIDKKFHFRSDVCTTDCKVEPQVKEMTMNQIINGSLSQKGLIPMICEHVQSQKDVDMNTRNLICNYMRFLSDRAAGKLPTNARYIRDFVQIHPQYNDDSRVTEKIQYDLLRDIRRLAYDEPLNEPDKLFGEYRMINARRS